MSREDAEELCSTSLMTEEDFASFVLSSFYFLRVCFSIFLFEFEIYLTLYTLQCNSYNHKNKNYNSITTGLRVKRLDDR